MVFAVEIPMNIKKIPYLVFISLIIASAALAIYLRTHSHLLDKTVSEKIDHPFSTPSTVDPTVLPDPHEEVPEGSIQRSASTILSKPVSAVSEMPSTQPEPPPPESLEVSPRPQVQAESKRKRSLPKPPPVVLPPEERSTVKLCGGEPICRCTNVDFTHGDFALLVLDILGLGTTQNCEEAFEILESLQIGPVDGWAKASPQRRMTATQMEEVRCAVSVASEDGLIPVGPSVVTAAVNRFCEELEVSLAAIEDSGVGTDRRDIRGETGYQGGTDGGVASSPF